MAHDKDKRIRCDLLKFLYLCWCSYNRKANKWTKSEL